MKYINTGNGRLYLWFLFSGIIVASSGAVFAQSIFFSPDSVLVSQGETKLVTVEVADIPVSGLAAFQFTLEYDAAALHILNPNEAYRPTVDPFAPLGNHPLCTDVRETATCDDPIWFLMSTGRNTVGLDSIDNVSGAVQVGYGTSGIQPLPVSNGSIAMIEVKGVTEGVFTVNIDPANLILANGNEPPKKFEVQSIGSLSVTVGDPPINNPPEVTNPGGQVNAEGDSVNLTITASDPDGDNLSYAAVGLPSGLTIDAASGIINGTVSPGAAADNAAIVTVTDDGVPNLDTTVNFNWKIGDPPLAPTQLVARGGNLKVNLRWKGSETATNFLVYRRLEYKDGTIETEFYEIDQTANRSYSEKLPPGTSLAEYFVIAENEYGKSESSEVISKVIK